MLSNRKIKIKLHGHLKTLYPDDLELAGRSVSELVNGMCKVTKAFNPKPGRERHSIKVIGYESLDALEAPLNDNVKEIHIVPEFSGGKKGGFFKVIVGAVLIVAAFYTAGWSLTALTAAGGLTTTGMLLNFGISLVLGGLLEMLSPQPKADKFGNSDADPEASKYLGANANTVKIGTRIPILYGEHQAFGHYISFDVDAVQVAV